MGGDGHIDWQREAASALAWWCEAGVEVLVDDAPRDWFARVTSAPAVAAPVPDGATMPETREAFAAWRVGPHAPDAGWHGTPLAATGPIDAALMILVDCPDRDDHEAGALLGGGAAGRLFGAMLAAIGASRESVHLAALCAKRPVAGRVPRDAEAALHEAARHHVGLAGARRLLVMGNAASRALLGMDVVDARGRLHRFNHKDREVEVAATFHPRFLLEQPVRKAEAWADLQRVTGGLA